MGFSRQEYWSGLPFPSPGDLPHAGFKPGSPTLQADSLSSEPPRYLQIWGQKNRERNGTSLLYGNTWRGLGFTLYLEAVCFSGSLISFPLIRFPPNPKSLVGFCALSIIWKPWRISIWENHCIMVSGDQKQSNFGAKVQAWILPLPEPKTVCRTITAMGYPQGGQCSLHPQGYLCNNYSHLPSAQGNFPYIF